MRAPVPPAREPSRTAVYLVAGFCCVLAIIYGFADIAPPPGVALGLKLLPLFTVAHWLHRDGRARGNRSLESWGLLFYVFWPILLPAYAIRTRGRAGWPLILELYGLILVAALGETEGRLLALLVGR
jgi:hypothetical protein